MHAVPSDANVPALLSTVDDGYAAVVISIAVSNAYAAIFRLILHSLDPDLERNRESRLEAE